MRKKINLLLMSEIEIENLDSLYLRKNIDNWYIQILIQINQKAKVNTEKDIFLSLKGTHTEKVETKTKHSYARYTPNQREQQAKKIRMQGYSSRSNTALKIKGKNRCKR